MTSLRDRLRALKPGPITASLRDADDPPVRLPINPDGPEAADKIDQLVEGLREANASLFDSLYHLRVDDAAAVYHRKAETLMDKLSTLIASVEGGE